MFTLSAFLSLVAGLSCVFIFRQTPRADIPQSERCREMCERRDDGSLTNLKEKSKEEIRGILAPPRMLMLRAMSGYGSLIGMVIKRVV